MATSATVTAPRPSPGRRLRQLRAARALVALLSLSGALAVVAQASSPPTVHAVSPWCPNGAIDGADPGGSLALCLAWSSRLPGGDVVNTSSPTVATIGGAPAVVVGTSDGWLEALRLSSGLADPGWPVRTLAAAYGASQQPSKAPGGPATCRNSKNAAAYPSLGVSGPISAAVQSGRDSTIYAELGGGNDLPLSAPNLDREPDYWAFSASGVALWDTNSNEEGDAAARGEDACNAADEPNGSVPALGGMTISGTGPTSLAFATSTTGPNIYGLDGASGAVTAGWPFINTDSQLTTPLVAQPNGFTSPVVSFTSDQTYNPGDPGSFGGGHYRELATSGNGNDETGREICNANIAGPGPSTDNYLGSAFDSSPALGYFGTVPLAVFGSGTRWAASPYDSDTLSAEDLACAQVWQSPALGGPTNFSPAVADVVGDGTPAVIEETAAAVGWASDGAAVGSGFDIYAIDGATGQLLRSPSCAGPSGVCELTLPRTQRILGASTVCGGPNVDAPDISVVTGDLSGRGYQDIVAPYGACGWAVIDGRTMTLVATIGNTDPACVTPTMNENNSALITQDGAGTVGITVTTLGCVYHYTTLGDNADVTGTTPAVVGSLSWPEFHHDPQLTGVSSSINPSNQIDVLGPGATLGPGQVLRSANSAYELSMQPQGNLVVYRVAPNGALTKVWANAGSGIPGSYLVMQAQGNLVLYSPEPHSRPLCSTATTAQAGLPTFLLLQGDGNLVVFEGPDPSRDSSAFDPATPLWASAAGSVCWPM